MSAHGYQLSTKMGLVFVHEQNKDGIPTTCVANIPAPASMLSVEAREREGARIVLALNQNSLSCPEMVWRLGSNPDNLDDEQDWVYPKDAPDKLMTVSDAMVVTAREGRRWACEYTTVGGAVRPADYSLDEYPVATRTA